MIISSNAANTNAQSPLGSSPLSSGFGGLAGFFASLLGSQTPNKAEGALPAVAGEQTESLSASKLLTDNLSFKDIDLETPQGRNALFDRIASITSQIQQIAGFEENAVNAQTLPVNPDGSKNPPILLGTETGAETQALYEELQVEISIVKTKLEVRGFQVSGFQTTSELAAAFEQLGMSPEEAQAQADRIEAAIAAMKAYLEKMKGEELPGELGALMASISSSNMALSPNVAAAQTQLTIEQTEISIKASHVKASFESSSSLSGTEKFSDKILQGEALSTPKAETALPTKNIAEQAAPKAETAPATATTVDGKPSIQETLAGQSEARQNAQVTSTAESVSNAIHEEDLAANTQRREDVTRNKPTYSESSETLSRLEGKKMFTARIEGAGVRLEYNDAPAEYYDPQAAESADGTGESLYGSKVDNTSTKQTSVHNPMAHTARAANVAAQTAIHMKTLAGTGGGEIKFRLHPEELGQVEIEMEVKEGKVRGSIAVENSEVAEYLARDLQKLQQGLEDAGLSFHEEGFTFLLKDEQQSGGGNEGHAGREDAEREEDDQIAISEEAASSTNWVSPDAILDVSV